MLLCYNSIYYNVHEYETLNTRLSRGSSLYLLEVSLDCSLIHSALHLELQDGSTIVPDVSIQELEGSSVAVLFATTSAVFRLLLPHPDAISKVYVCACQYFMCSDYMMYNVHMYMLA